jgi:DNA-binding MarR family transcriptional regulator
MERLPEDRLTKPELAAWKGMLATHARIVAMLDAELREEHELTLQEYEVLMNLTDASDGRLRMSELADEVLLSRSGLTRVVDRLERRGLVARMPAGDDGRGYFAQLETEGKRLVSKARRTHLAGVRRHFTSHLKPGELGALAGAWQAVAAD